MVNKRFSQFGTCLVCVALFASFICRYRPRLSYDCMTSLICHRWVTLVATCVKTSMPACRPGSRLWRIRRLVSQPVLLSLVTSLIMTRLIMWLWLVFPVTCWTVCSPYLMLRHVWSACVTRRSTTTTSQSSPGPPLVASSGKKLKEYNFDWPYSFSAAVTTWRPHTSSAIFNGLTKRSRCNDYGPALNSGWSYLERDSEPSVTDLSVWRLLVLVHGTVFQPCSVTTATSLASFKRQLKTFLFTKSFP